jgi:hypothetical protein
MAKTRKVAFTEDAANRVARATLAYERGNRDQSPINFRTVGDDGDPIRIGKTPTEWTKGTTKTITLWETGTPPNETQGGGTLEGCVNKFGTVGANKWVALMRGVNGKFYLIAAEC